jgi:hypothetical protein
MEAFGIKAAVRALEEEARTDALMHSIAFRHVAGRSTGRDRDAYRALWVAATLRRSAGRRPYVPVAVDELLEERSNLEPVIQDLQACVAIEAVFRSTPEDETPPTAAHH